MMSKLGSRLVLAMVAMAACSAGDITAPNALTEGPGAKQADDYSSTSRTGLTITYNVGGDVYDHYWFSANKDTRGNVSGNFLLWELRVSNESSWASVYVWGKVVCITTSGTKARLGAVVTWSSFAGIPAGSALTWSVTDNGKTGQSSDDTASAMYGVADAYAYCAGGLPYPETSMLQGGVQVTP